MKTLKLFLFLLIISYLFQTQIVFADKEIKTERTLEGQIILTEEKPCELLDDIIVGISHWSKAKEVTNSELTIDSTLVEKIKSTIESNKNECKLNITKFLPKSIQKVAGMMPLYDGPNCWNTSLILAEIIPYSTYTSPREMNFWMNSPFCRPLKVDEKLLPGDIFAIRETQSSEVHGFTYVWNNTVFSKNGFSREVPFLFTTKKAVLNHYGVLGKENKDVRVNNEGKLEPAPTRTYSQAFRCKSPRNSSHNEKNKTNIILNNISNCYESITLGNKLVSKSFKVLLAHSKNSINAIQVLSEKKIESLSLKLSDKTSIQEREELEFWNGVNLRTNGLIEQADFIRDKLNAN